MKTRHGILFESSADMGRLSPGSIDLVVTSPPYPMIEMWDGLFAAADPAVSKHLNREQGPQAFESMHRILDPVWREIYRVLRPGGIACINIGDATRTLGGNFALYPNHSRILSFLLKTGFQALPAILWRKQTNAPNKFMGSGMMPPGAYVTLEHEYILIVRKGEKREFSIPEEKRNRRESGYFWEERNTWFSDVWMDLKGTRQELFDPKARKRSAAFPFELAYRLINMFSVKGDTVLDPFLGIGTTMYGAMASARNSVGFEIDSDLKERLFSGIEDIVELSSSKIADRIESHMVFVKERIHQKGPLKYANAHYSFPVVTRQETQLFFNEPQSAEILEDSVVEVIYSDAVGENHIGNWDASETSNPIASPRPPTQKRKNRQTHRQKTLF